MTGGDLLTAFIVGLRVGVRHVTFSKLSRHMPPRMNDALFESGLVRMNFLSKPWGSHQRFCSTSNKTGIRPNLGEGGEVVAN